MLVFLDLIYPYILATTVISFLGLWISMVLFFGISGLELRNQSSENLNTFFRKRHVKYISFVGIASLLILMLIRGVFEQNTIYKIKKNYLSENYHIYWIPEENINSLHLDFTSLKLAEATRATHISNKDSLLFIFKVSNTKFKIKLKKAVFDNNLYFLYIIDYNYTSGTPYATIRKLNNP